MPGQRGSENRQRNRMFTMRLDDAEWVRLDEIAHHSGVSRADVIRRMLVHDHSRIVPSRALTDAITRICQNVNQIARALNQLGANGGSVADTTSMLLQQHARLQTVVSELVQIRREMERWR